MNHGRVKDHIRAAAAQLQAAIALMEGVERRHSDSKGHKNLVSDVLAEAERDIHVALRELTSG
jgi:hypothetical protein